MAFRFATLAMALAVVAQAAAQSDEGTTVEAEAIEGVADLEVTARGSAEIRHGDMTIFGESLRFNTELGRAEADGGVRMQRGADRFFGPHLRYNTQENTGVFESPTYILQRERVARGSAERVEFLGPGRYRLTEATYTTCEPGREDWVLQASELELDFDDENGQATNPRLRFFDTTIIASPWATFPLGKRRRSGVLTPYYSQTTTRGLEIGLPYYWNIAPELDATITPVVMAKRGYQLKNEVRYLQPSYAGEIKLEYLPDDEIFNDSREGVSWQHAHTVLPGLTGQVDYNKVSDDRYFVDLASQVKQVSVGNLPQEATLTQTGSFSRHMPYAAQARLQRFQTLQDPLAPIVPPYHRMPQLNFSTGYNELGGVLDLTVPVEYVRFTHPTSIEGARTVANPTLALPLLAPGYYVTPKAGIRASRYSLSGVTDPAQPQDPSVSVPWLTVDSGLVFEREAASFGDGATQTVEPRLFYVYVPYRDQDQIPLFDTALADFNYAQLFTENRFVGGDRFGDANQLTVALSSRFLQPNGQEALRATVGQRYYFASERVGLTPASPLRATTDSDILAALGARLGPRWTFDSAAQYNRHEQRGERYSVAMRYAPETAKVLNASYRYNREALKQIDISTQWPIAPGWYGVGRYNYSLLDKRLLEGLAGFEYNAGCWVLRAVVQRIRAATDVSTTTFILQIEFNGIGTIGTEEAVEFLRRNVPGYSVTNPANSQLAPPSARPQLPFEQTY